MTGGNVGFDIVTRISHSGFYIPSETSILSAGVGTNKFKLRFVYNAGWSLTYTVQFNATKKDGSIVQRFVKMV